MIGARPSKDWNNYQEIDRIPHRAPKIGVSVTIVPHWRNRSTKLETTNVSVNLGTLFLTLRQSGVARELAG